jgi:hypothetical protein
VRAVTAGARGARSLGRPTVLSTANRRGAAHGRCGFGQTGAATVVRRAPLQVCKHDDASDPAKMNWLDDHRVSARRTGREQSKGAIRGVGIEVAPEVCATWSSVKLTAQKSFCCIGMARRSTRCARP